MFYILFIISWDLEMPNTESLLSNYLLTNESMLLFWESIETVRRSNLSILKEISPEYSLEGLMLKLKLQYFGHLVRRADSLEKTLMLGKIEAGGEGEDRGWAGWMASPTRWTWVWISSGSWWWTGKPGVPQSVGSQSGPWLSDWTELNLTKQIEI